jgi:3-carboxy-cis,cis-muconate cycloisomerase
VSVSIFDSFLTTPDMIAAFDDAAVVQAMLSFEAALARAQAAEGLIPPAAASAIEGVCKAQLYDIPALIRAGQRAGSLAIPLVKELQKTVALYDEEAARHVHWGSTSQDVIDSALVLATRQALRLIDEGVGELCGHLLRLSEAHLATPVLARTLMQPAQVSSFGFKAAGWLAPLVRARTQLRAQAARSLQLQLGGAVGTLAVMGEHGAAVAARMAADLRLHVADAAWHTQRDEWVRLGLEVAVLGGSLGKLATDLGLMAQGEVAELAEPSGNGRGGSSAMPHKRNPVSTMIALAAARRTPQHAAALLACMDQQHERGLGNWQAELAEWPQLFLSVHGALHALNEAFAGLLVDHERMLSNIHALNGLVFAEAASSYLAAAIGRPRAHALLEDLSRRAAGGGQGLEQLLHDAVKADPQLAAHVDPGRLAGLFDPVAATEPARRLAEAQLRGLRLSMAKLDATHPFHEHAMHP